MTVQTYTIDSVIPEPVMPQGVTAPITVYNASSTDVCYINDSTVGNGFPLDPGSTITWDAALFASVDEGKTVRLVTLSNGGTITNAKAIATAIVNEGLAGDIANALVASSLSGDTASSIAASGAPTLNKFTELYKNDNVTPLTSPYQLAMLNVSGYKSLFIVARETSGSATVVPSRQLRLKWHRAGTVDAFSQLAGDTFYICRNSAGTGDGGTFINVPVGGPQLAVEIEGNSSFPTTAGSVSISVYGSYQECESDSRMVSKWAASPDNDMFEDSYSFIIPSKVAGVNELDTIHSRSGAATLSVLLGTVTTAGLIRLRDARNTSISYWAWQVPASATVQTEQVRLNLPPRPVTWDVQTTMVGTNFRFSLAYESR